ncbi:MAG: hypothetical protein ACI9TH_001971 [Kiritimatiellia bacterium]|jgi:hypothetical protein
MFSGMGEFIPALAAAIYCKVCLATVKAGTSSRTQKGKDLPHPDFIFD